MALDDKQENEAPLEAESKLFENQKKHHPHPPVSDEEKHEQISKIAHHVWESRGGGHSLLAEKQDDWRTAEQLWEQAHSCEDDFSE